MVVASRESPVCQSSMPVINGGRFSAQGAYAWQSGRLTCCRKSAIEKLMYQPDIYWIMSGFTQENIVHENIVEVNDSNFDSEVLQSELPVLVDYWAEWCGPCKMIAPILDEIAEEYGDKVKIAKLNIDENQNTPPKYGIRGIPTLMLFKNGSVEGTKVGALSKSQLSAFIDSNS
jgi:thioredoxin 1